MQAEDGNPEAAGVLSARIMAPALRYVEEQHGARALDALLGAAGVPATRARDPHVWLTHAEFEALATAVRGALGSDAEFLRACAHRMKEAYDPLFQVTRANTVRDVYRLMARTFYVVTRISQMESADLSGARMWLRYTSPLPESRLMCLSRIAQLACGPTIFGLGAAQIEERQCLARGAGCCEYVVRWQE
jgi:hypothetical protein